MNGSVISLADTFEHFADHLFLKSARRASPTTRRGRSRPPRNVQAMPTTSHQTSVIALE